MPCTLIFFFVIPCTTVPQVLYQWIPHQDMLVSHMPTFVFRKISVMDVSKKFGMDFRLLHAVTSGQTWYGNWGYEFGAGSFALTLGVYQTAVKEISDIPIASFLSDGNDGQPPPARLRDVIVCYLSISGNCLATVKDLFCFILQLLHDSHKQGKDSKTSRAYEIPLSLWSDNDVKRAECAMIKVLKAINGSHWVSWKALKGASFRAGPPQLLDYCLKELGGRVIDSKIVDVRRNSETDVIEYRCDIYSLQSSLLHPGY